VAWGTGTPGCLGIHEPTAVGAPLLGNAGFGLSRSKAPSSVFGYLLVGEAADLAGSDLLGLGVVLHLDLLPSPDFFLQPIVSDASGANFLPTLLPDLPLLAGATFHAQAAWFWSACTPLLFGWSTTRLLRLTLQAGS
jgi:hypothetical protein